MATIWTLIPDKALEDKVARALARDGHTPVALDSVHPMPEVTDGEPVPPLILDARIKWTLCRPLLRTLADMGCAVLFLTAEKQLFSHLHALYHGVTEAVAIPFSQKALLTRLHGILQQTQPLKPLELLEDERAALLDGERVELTAQEFALLLALMESADAPISREELLRKAWGYQSIGETRTVDVHVQRLRRKLGEERIETVYRFGYRLVSA